jgi:hypothetical protein
MRLWLAIAAASAVAAAAVAAADARPAPLASVHVTSCQLSPTSSDRSATFVSTMNAVPGTARMSMRFRLRQRVPGGHATPVHSRALETWRRSRPGVPSFTYSQTVNGLPPTSVYWMAVDYRWLGPRGHVIHTATRISGVCSEVGGLNKLKIKAVTAQYDPTSGGARYDFTLLNTGHTTQRNMRLRLYVDHTPGAAAQLDAIDPGQTQPVELVGPTCSRSLHLIVQRDGDLRRYVLGWHCPPLQ